MKGVGLDLQLVELLLEIFPPLAPGLAKLPTSSFFFVSTEMTGVPRSMHSSAPLR
jgi:hypothetical protein